MLASFAQKITETLEFALKDTKKKYEIEWLKALGATTFEGSTDPAYVKAWLNLVEKCFKVMGCREERQVRLASFLLQKEAENWLKSIEA